MEEYLQTLKQVSPGTEFPLDLKEFKVPLRSYQKVAASFSFYSKNCILGDPTGTGKSQSLDSLVLTDKGFVKMGSVSVGDKVAQLDGNFGLIESIHPQGKLPTYEVLFTDGTKAECSEDHLWQVRTKYQKFDAKRAGQTYKKYKSDDRLFVRGKGKHWSVKTLHEIKKDFKYKDGYYKYEIPIVQPVKFPYKDLSLDPYFLGLLLGDGSIKRCVSFHSCDTEILEWVEKMPLLPGISIRKELDKRNNLVSLHFRNRNEFPRKKNPYVEILRSLGLYGCDSFSKFIPNEFKLGSIDQRIAVLQGLLDTDGRFSSGGGSIEFISKSKFLATDVKFLVESLGGVCRFLTKNKSWTFNGEKKSSVYYILYIRFGNEIKPFRLLRKLESLKFREKYFPMRKIKAIDYVGEKDCQCIQVTASDNLYITDNFIVTHNTVEALASCALIDKKKPINHVLIITPYSLRQWQEEIDRFLGWDSILIRSVPKIKRKKLWVASRSNFFTITNYHMLINDFEVVKDLSWDVVIYDEASCFKNGDTQRFLHVQDFSKRVLKKGGWVLGLSATPMEGKFEDLWGVMSGIGLNLGTFESYVRRYCEVQTIPIWLWKKYPRLVHKGQRKYCPSCNNLVYAPYKSCSNPRCSTTFKWKKEIQKVVGCKDLQGLKYALRNNFIMRTKESLLPELPRIVLEFVKLPLVKEQKDLIKDVRHQDLNETVKVIFEREICNSTKVYNKSGKHVSPKLEWLKSALDGCLSGQKVILFSQFKEMLRGAIDVVNKAGLEYVLVTGDLSKEEQEQEVYKFKNEPTTMILLGTCSIEKSWNLQEAGIMVCFDMIMNPARMTQLYGRIERSGSKHSSIIAYNLIMEESVEEEILDIISEKVGNVEDVFGHTNMSFNLESELIRRRNG